MLRQLERYEILDEIAQGGMATVYRARDSKLDRLVALKVMHPHLRGAEEARIRFAREARTIAKLHHPNIIEIYDFSGKDSEDVYIATELLTGPTLKGFIEKHPDIPAEIAACVAIHVARALAVSHDEGVVHRDVKPENILIHQARAIKLTDFGLAQMRDTQSMTVTGQILGSPGHMSPEQVEGKDCDARSDIFSLGTVLYALSVGELPFVARTPHKVLMLIVQGDYADPLRRRPAIGADLARIIQRCMQTAPEARYASAIELERDLTAFVAAMGIEDPTRQLADYLAEPESVAQVLRHRAIERSIVLGDSARDRRDYSKARDHYNRVLALEPGQPQVLASLASMGRARVRIRGLFVFGLLALAAIVGTTAVALLRTTQLPAHSRRGLPQDSPIAAKPSVEATGPGATKPETPSGQGLVRTERSGNRRAKRGPVLGLRTVVFRPSPQNVSISVDDGPLRAFGPDFQDIQLEPGLHRFKIVGAQGCCVDQEFQLKIPAGEAPFVLQRSLALRPAILVVRSNVPADVMVGDGLAKGRSHSALVVDIGDSFRSVQRVTVSAPERSNVVRSVVLEAGKVTEIDITLSGS